MVRFAFGYADQTEIAYQALKVAAKSGRTTVSGKEKPMRKRRKEENNGSVIQFKIYNRKLG